MTVSETIRIRPLAANDYPAAARLWQACEGVVLRADDSRESYLRFLDRNPGLSLGAFADEELVGAVMVGHDARRAYIYHLAVTPGRRRAGMGRQLVERIIGNLKSIGIDKLHVFVVGGNRDAEQFWRRMGCHERPELVMFSRVMGE